MPKKELLELENAETISENIDAKKGALYGYDLDNNQWRRLAVDADGKLKTAGDTLYLKLDQTTPQTIINGGLYINGTTGDTPTSGAGTRLMWIPAKSAFRAGTVTASQWDAGNIGTGTVAIGTDSVAQGANSIALGPATANGINAIAIGYGTVAFGESSLALGYNVTSTHTYSTSIGKNFTNVTSNSIALGIDAIDLLITSGLADFQDTNIVSTGTLGAGVITGTSFTVTSATGASLSAAAGVLTMGGIGNTNNAYLNFDFETLIDTEKAVTVSGVASSVTHLLFSGKSSDASTVSFGIDFNDSTYGPVIHGDCADGYERIFFRGTLTAMNLQYIYFGSSSPCYIRWNTANYDFLQLAIKCNNAINSGNIVITSADSGNIPTANYPLVVNPTLRIQASTTDINDYIQFFHNQTNAQIGWGDGSLVLEDNIIIGVGTAATDYTLTFDGETNDGLLTWMEDEDYFQFGDDININTGEVLKVGGTQVVSARVVDARCDDAINSGDATTDGVIDSLRDAMIAHGLIAAA